MTQVDRLEVIGAVGDAIGEFSKGSCIIWPLAVQATQNVDLNCAAGELHRTTKVGMSA